MSQEVIDKKNNVEFFIDLVCDVLTDKNKKYGNAALKPINVFYKGEATNSILIRLDDKLSRIKHSKELRKNDIFDFLGYLFLLCLSENYFGTDSIEKFTDKMKILKNNILIRYEQKTEDKVFSKDYIKNKYEAIQIIKMNSVCEQLVDEVICAILNYFIENNITDFKDILE